MNLVIYILSVMKLTRLIILSQENISTKIVKFDVSFVLSF